MTASCGLRLSIVAAFFGAMTPALAQQSTTPALSLTLNSTMTTEEGGCRLIFVLQNDLGAALERLVASLTLFDFGALPEGRPRVRQFDLAGQGCDGIGAVLINGIGTCDGAGLAPGACIGALHLASETEIEVTG